jgi:hypothetical protein
MINTIRRAMSRFQSLYCAGRRVSLLCCLPSLVIIILSTSSSGIAQDQSIGGSSEAAPADTISSDWEKPRPIIDSFQTQNGQCGLSGKDGTGSSAAWKNRIDEPHAPHDISPVAMQSLPIPNVSLQRQSWNRKQQDAISAFEGIPVRLAGYISSINVANPIAGDPENCNSLDPADLNWSVSLINGPSSIPAAITARTRRSHPRWTFSFLKPWVGTGLPVRITGWLFFNNGARPLLNLEYQTLWQIAPITRIEVRQNGAWVNLDELK